MRDVEARPSTSDVAVLIVSYNGLAWLSDCLTSILASPDAPPPAQIIVVDNASNDGSANLVRSKFAAVTLITLPSNTGFVGGNNLGFAQVRERMPHVRYIALLNQDTIVAPGWLAALAEGSAASGDIASVQVKLMLHPETKLINSVGNKSHYLGFGFVSAYREEDTGQYDAPRDLAFCSGAAMLVRVDAIGRPHLFDPAYYAYLEDAELGWYLRLKGLRNVYCPKSVVYHRYQFRRNPQMYYRLESNRWRLLLTQYRWRTLVLLLPAVLMMEVGLLFYFARNGAMCQKLRSWRMLFELPAILRERRLVQAQRRISDRQLTAPFISSADFPEVRSPLLTWIGNPLLTAYWRMARLLLWW